VVLLPAGAEYEEEEEEEKKVIDVSELAGANSTEIAPASGESMGDLLKEINDELSAELPPTCGIVIKDGGVEQAATSTVPHTSSGTSSSMPPKPNAPPTSASIAKAKGVKLNQAPAASGWRARQGKQQAKLKHPESWSKKQKSRHKGPSRPGGCPCCSDPLIDKLGAGMF
jgi:hypothetical protein